MLQLPAQGDHRDFAKLTSRNFPDLWIQDLDGYGRFVLNLVESLDNRIQRYVAIPGQDPVGIFGELARYVAQVAQLDMEEIIGMQQV